MTTSQNTTTTTKPRRLRRRVGIAAFAIGLAAAPIAAGAAGSDTEPTYTGCLDGAGEDAGRVYAVGAGSSPLRACEGSDTEIALSGGDLTSITAGSGLRATSGDPLGIVDTQGDVTLDLAPAYRLPQGCPNGKPVVREATGWQCGSFPVAPTYDRIYSATSRTRMGVPSVNISDNWANISDPFNLPAGDWHVTASAFIYYPGEDLTPDCRLNAAGDLDTRLDESSTSSEYDGLFMQGVVSSDVPFTVVVACKDWGRGSKWRGLHIVATEGHGVHGALLNAHE